MNWTQYEHTQLLRYHNQLKTILSDSVVVIFQIFQIYPNSAADIFQIDREMFHQTWLLRFYKCWNLADFTSIRTKCYLQTQLLWFFKPLKIILSDSVASIKKKNIWIKFYLTNIWQLRFFNQPKILAWSLKSESAAKNLQSLNHILSHSAAEGVQIIKINLIRLYSNTILSY